MNETKEESGERTVCFCYLLERCLTYASWTCITWRYGHGWRGGRYIKVAFGTLAKNRRIERKCGALIRATDSSARRKTNETSLGKMYAPMNLEISGIREIIKDIMSSARHSSSMKATAKCRSRQLATVSSKYRERCAFLVRTDGLKFMG